MISRNLGILEGARLIDTGKFCHHSFGDTAIFYIDTVFNVSMPVHKASPAFSICRSSKHQGRRTQKTDPYQGPRSSAVDLSLKDIRKWDRRIFYWGVHFWHTCVAHCTQASNTWKDIDSDPALLSSTNLCKFYKKMFGNPSTLLAIIKPCNKFDTWSNCLVLLGPYSANLGPQTCFAGRLSLHP